MSKLTETASRPLRVSSAGEAYRYPQPAGLVAVKDYLFAHTEEGHCLLLRWVMEADFPVESFTFTVEQLDAVGDPVGQATVTCAGEDIPSVKRGECFTPERGIAVHERCSAVRIHLSEVVSEGYVYRVKGTQVEMDYRPDTPWRYEANGGAEDGLSDTVSLSLHSKLRDRGSRVRFLWPLALLSFLLILLIILAPALPRGEGRIAAERATYARLISEAGTPDGVSAD